MFIAINANVKANMLDELIALAKSKPGAINYDSVEAGNIHHPTAEAMNVGLGISMSHVPYKGSANSVPAMTGGQVDTVFASPPSLMGFVKTGQARLLATNSSVRSSLAPQMPTLEKSIPWFSFTVAALGQKGTLCEVIHRINAEIDKIVKVPKIIEQLHAEKAQVTDAVARAHLKAE